MSFVSTHTLKYELSRVNLSVPPAYPFQEIILAQSLSLCEQYVIDGKVCLESDSMLQPCDIYNILHDTTYARQIYLNSIDVLNHSIFKNLCRSTWYRLKLAYPGLTNHIEKDSDLSKMSKTVDLNEYLKTTL